MNARLPTGKGTLTAHFPIPTLAPLMTLALITLLGASAVFLLPCLPVSAHAQVSHTPVLGDFEFSELTVSCPANPSGCFTCVNDADTTGDHRLMLVLGASFPNLVTTGRAEGVLRPFLDIDGVRVTPDLFPCGAVLRAGIQWLDRPLAQTCDGTPVSVTYQIGNDPEVTVTGDGNTQVLIPADQAHEIPFRFEVCSELVYWGAGCGISGSSMHGFRLDMPGRLDALQVEPGDSEQVAVSSSQFAIDFLSSPGGVVSVSRVQADVPGTPFIEHLNGYWDVHTNMPPDSFTAEVTLDLNAVPLPPEVNPAAVAIAVFDPAEGNWQLLDTRLDLLGGTATATTHRLSKFVVVESEAVPNLRSSWGLLKAAF